METLTPDICVIGGGAGGLTVAAAAAAFGVPVVLVEKSLMGGECLNHGCVPSKALIAAARQAHAIAEAPRFGVSAGEARVDFGRVNRHLRSVIEAIAPNDSVERFTALGVRVVSAEARFVDARTVEAGGFRIRARRFVLATGSRPRVPPIPGLDEVACLTSETLFERTRKPKHLIVLGAGPVGMEMAQAHRRLGAEVTVVETGRALGGEDPELAAIVVERLRAEGVAIVEGAAVTAVEKRGKSGLTLRYEKDGAADALAGSDLLLAAGRAPATAGLGLDAAGIAHDEGGIVVGPGLRTANRRVYAIGDAVSGGPRLTHAANMQAGVVLKQILFRLPARKNRTALPRAVFTDPELAHVGLTEAEAREAHGRLSVLRWPYAENDRAQAEHATCGHIKLLADRRGRILGVSIVGRGAAEMIGFWSLALSAGMRLSDVRDHIAPYPTMSEIGKRAAISYYQPMTRRPWVRRLIALLRRFG